ncbi:hypothetical protein [Alteromonas lipotrueiana]|mgnify:CR=1 FL=1|uniref:hypothetical protein n=1 Tax=Alteromonas lipotrueiana TaxID=2803815 RepID=UPI001C4578AD|nr:hypothetical protein [Alteromonas lipotrueiana]
MSVYLGVSAGIFSLYVLINLWAMHSQRLNRPNYVLTELDSLVGVRHNSLARLSARFTTFVEKHHIRRIQVSHECLTLFTDTNDFVDIWLCDEYLFSNASRAKTLFPDAEFVRTFA